MTSDRETKYTYHYTTVQKGEQIFKSSQINPTDTNVPINETPIVWFSSRQDWEPTANKGMINEMGCYVSLDKWETYTFGGGLIRFGVDPDILVPFPKIGRLSNMTKSEEKRLIRSGKQMGSNHTDWFGTNEPVKKDKWLVIEYWKSGETLESGKWERFPDDPTFIDWYQVRVEHQYQYDQRMVS